MKLLLFVFSVLTLTLSAQTTLTVDVQGPFPFCQYYAIVSNTTGMPCLGQDQDIIWVSMTASNIADTRVKITATYPGGIQILEGNLAELKSEIKPYYSYSYSLMTFFVLPGHFKPEQVLISVEPVTVRPKLMFRPMGGKR